MQLSEAKKSNTQRFADRLQHFEVKEWAQRTSQDWGSL